MFCPYCSAEMQAGYLQSSRYLIWDKEEKDGCILPDKERGGFFLTRGIFHKNAILSYHCQVCRLLLTPLPNTKEKAHP